MFAEGVGEDLEVFEVLVLCCRIELHPGHGEVEEDAVVDLAERSTAENITVSLLLVRCDRDKFVLRERRHDLPSAALLDFGHIKLQQTVEPCQQFLPVCARSALVYRIRLLQASIP